MLIKRLALVAISLVIGVIIMLLGIQLMATNLPEFGMEYFLPCVFFCACGVGIWLDKFMGTEILPE